VPHGLSPSDVPPGVQADVSDMFLIQPPYDTSFDNPLFELRVNADGTEPLVPHVHQGRCEFTDIIRLAQAAGATYKPAGATYKLVDPTLHYGVQ